jgi:uncharacterized protein YkwD
MRIILLTLLTSIVSLSNAQAPDSLNTAKRCAYMTKQEQDMIGEINLIRSNPQGYVRFITPMLADAKKQLARDGKGAKNYSISTSTSTVNGQTKKNIDTTWHFINDENVKALTSLISDLKRSHKLSILKPDSGIYLAAKKHAADQHAHEWTLSHQGSDGSWPWDRILKFSPLMSAGNENIAMMSGSPSVRDIVILLLVDAGIPGYGHRHNMLDPNWTHAACTGENFQTRYYWWLQEFGAGSKN